MAARIHHRLVFIHPFENGNGRFSRLIADRFLFAFKCSYPLWPSHLNKEGIMRKDYIDTLKNADRGDYSSLMDFMKKLGASELSLVDLFTNKSYEAYIKGERGEAIVKAMLKNGSNPNDQTSNGHRPLHSAVKAGLDQIAIILIAAGAEIDVKDRSGLTPIQIAVLQENILLADFLMSQGAKQLM